MNAYRLWVFEFVLYLKENPWDLHNLLLPPNLKNLLVVMAAGIPTQTQRVFAPQEYKS